MWWTPEYRSLACHTTGMLLTPITDPATGARSDTAGGVPSRRKDATCHGPQATPSERRTRQYQTPSARAGGSHSVPLDSVTPLVTLIVANPGSRLTWTSKADWLSPSGSEGVHRNGDAVIQSGPVGMRLVGTG